jgi:hypothetical protein
MVLLGDVAQVEARFGPFGYSANLDARKVHSLRQMYHRLKNCFGHTRWNPSVTWVMWNLILFRLEIGLALLQDRCSFCFKHTIGSEIVLDAPDGALRCRGSSGCLIWSVWR